MWITTQGGQPDEHPFTGVRRRIELLQDFRNAALVLNKELKICGADNPAKDFQPPQQLGMKAYIMRMLMDCIAIKKEA